jgi:hypothetical protein
LLEFFHPALARGNQKSPRQMLKKSELEMEWTPLSAKKELSTI